MEEKQITRRSALKAAAWTVPAIAVAIATPALASSEQQVGNLAINGACGLAGVFGPGFDLNADPSYDLPIGTQITITGSGIANIGVIDLNLNIASVNVLNNTTRQFTLTSPVPAGATLEFRTALSLSLGYTLQASVALPPNYTAGSEAKLAGSLENSLFGGCNPA